MVGIRLETLRYFDYRWSFFIRLLSMEQPFFNISSKIVSHRGGCNAAIEHTCVIPHFEPTSKFLLVIKCVLSHTGPREILDGVTLMKISPISWSHFLVHILGVYHS